MVVVVVVVGRDQGKRRREISYRQADDLKFSPLVAATFRGLTHRRGKPTTA